MRTQHRPDGPYFSRRVDPWTGHSLASFLRAAGLAAVLAAILAAILATPGAEAANRVHVPLADGDWQVRLSRAESFAARGSYQRAIEILQNAIDFGKDRLVLVEGEDVHEPLRPAGEGIRERTVLRRYVSVAERARGLILALPPDGREAYRHAHAPIAERLLRESIDKDDLHLLERAAMDYFPTPAAARARLRWADHLFEMGNVRRAYRLWMSLVTGPLEDPQLADDLHLRVLTALRVLGDEAGYREARRRAEERIRTQAGADGMPPELAARALAGIERIEAQVPLSSGIRAAAVLIGGEEREAGAPARLPGLAAVPGGFVKKWENPWWAREGIERGVLSGHRGGRQLHAPFPRVEFRNGFPTSGSASFFPAVSGGDGFISGVFNLWKIDLQSGKVEANPRKPLIPDNAWRFLEKTESPVYSTVVDRGIIFTHTITHLVPFSHYLGYTITEDLPTRALVAYDARSLEGGDDPHRPPSPPPQPLWHTAGFHFGSPDDPRSVSFVTPPLVRGEKVYAGGGFIAGYLNGLVAAFDRLTGRPLWSTLVASHQHELTMFGEPAREPLAYVLAESEGILYCVTGLGVVAALDGETGHILWLSTYDSIGIVPSIGPFPVKRELLWGINPPLLVGGTLIAAPRDSAHLYAFDTGLGVGPGTGGPGSAGKILWSFPNSGRLRDLLGHRNGRLYFSGPREIRALEISSLEGREDPAVILARSPAILAEDIPGRAAMAEQGIVYCDRSRLRLADYALAGAIDLLAGPMEESDHGDPAGNVVICGDRILVTSRDLLTCFEPRPEAGRIPAAKAGD